ncbi:MAG TPA: helix-turn-helix domain-containing protein [Acidimicrobiales bacterium]|nr:helix-turn-helix domain-containing protein [Acidimicrobiales bacterium]
MVLAIARARLDELVTMVLDAVVFLPGYTSDFRPSFADDVRSSVRYTTERFLEALVEERSLSTEELVSLTIIGARRAHLPREVVVTGAAAACDAGLDFLLDVAREVPAPGPVAVAAVQWFKSALAQLRQEAVEALRKGHANEQERAPQTLARRRTWLVDRLVYGIWDEPAELAREATALGCELAPPFALLLVTASDNTDLDSLRAAITTLVERLPTSIEGPARPFPSECHGVILLPRHSVSDEAVLAGSLAEAAAKCSVYVVCPDAAASVADLPTTYSRTARDLSLPKRVHLRPGIVSAGDLAYYRLITRASPEELADFAERFVGPLLRSKAAGKLIETLEALYRAPDVASAATALQVHENTVYYRIRTTTELTGCDLSVPAEADKVFAALRLRFAIDPDVLRPEDGEGDGG